MLSSATLKSDISRSGTMDPNLMTLLRKVNIEGVNLLILVCMDPMPGGI